MLILIIMLVMRHQPNRRNKVEGETFFSKKKKKTQTKANELLWNLLMSYTNELIPERLFCFVCCRIEILSLALRADLHVGVLPMSIRRPTTSKSIRFPPSLRQRSLPGDSTLQHRYTIVSLNYINVDILVNVLLDIGCIMETIKDSKISQN